jgi:hypothetical protein
VVGTTVVTGCPFDTTGRSVIILKIDTTGRSVKIDTTGRSVIILKIDTTGRSVEDRYYR